MDSNISRLIEHGIDEMGSEFESRPYNFYSETDMHLRLYVLLRDRFTLSIAGKQIDLIHAEFPTFSTFKSVEKHMFDRDSSGVTGAYDLVILDPNDLKIPDKSLAIWRPAFGVNFRPRLLAAIECKLSESKGNYRTHIHNDVIKLDEPDSLVQYKYMIQFVRNMIRSKSAYQHFNDLKAEISCRIKATNKCNNIKVKYVEIRKDAAPINEWITS